MALSTGSYVSILPDHCGAMRPHGQAIASSALQWTKVSRESRMTPLRHSGSRLERPRPRAEALEKVSRDALKEYYIHWGEVSRSQGIVAQRPFFGARNLGTVLCGNGCPPTVGGHPFPHKTVPRFRAPKKNRVLDWVSDLGQVRGLCGTGLGVGFGVKLGASAGLDWESDLGSSMGLLRDWIESRILGQVWGLCGTGLAGTVGKRPVGMGRDGSRPVPSRSVGRRASRPIPFRFVPPRAASCRPVPPPSRPAVPFRPASSRFVPPRLVPLRPVPSRLHICHFGSGR